MATETLDEPENLAEKLNGFFDPMSMEEASALVAELERIPEIVAGANQAPEQIKNSLDLASDDFLRGYMLGMAHAVRAHNTMVAAATREDQQTYMMVQQRLDTITYMVCRKLTTGGSRIILS